MVDVGRAIAILVGLVFCVRARGWFAVTVVLCVAYVCALEIAGGILSRGTTEAHAGFAFVLVFLGPSGLPRALVRGFPLAEAIARHPIAVNVGTAACVAVPWWGLERRSAPLYPESDEAHRVDRAAVQLVLLIVLDLILAGWGAFLAGITRDGS